MPNLGMGSLSEICCKNNAELTINKSSPNLIRANGMSAIPSKTQISR